MSLRLGIYGSQQIFASRLRREKKIFAVDRTLCKRRGWLLDFQFRESRSTKAPKKATSLISLACHFIFCGGAKDFPPHMRKREAKRKGCSRRQTKVSEKIQTKRKVFVRKISFQLRPLLPRAEWFISTRGCGNPVSHGVKNNSSKKKHDTDDRNPEFEMPPEVMVPMSIQCQSLTGPGACSLICFRRDRKTKEQYDRVYCLAIPEELFKCFSREPPKPCIRSIIPCRSSF